MAEEAVEKESPAAKTGPGSNDNEPITDIPTLLSFLKHSEKKASGGYSKQVAALHLMNMAITDEEKCLEIWQAGCGNTLLSNISNAALPIADRTACAGVMCALARDEEVQRELVRAKAQGRQCPAILVDLLIDSSGSDVMAAYVARALSLLSQNPAANATIHKVLGDEVPWSVFTTLLESGLPTETRSDIAAFVHMLVIARTELAVEAGRAGIVSALLVMLRSVPRAKNMETAACCLWKLLGVEDNRTLAMDADAVRILCDILHEPPAGVKKWEALIARSAASSGRSGSFLSLQMGADNAIPSPADKDDAAAASLKDTPSLETSRLNKLRSFKSKINLTINTENTRGGSILLAGGRRGAENSTGSPGSNGQGSLSSSKEQPSSSDQDHNPEAAAVDRWKTAMSRARPLIVSPPLRERSTAMSWAVLRPSRLTSAVAGCLQKLMMTEEHLEKVSIRLAASRIVPLLERSMKELDDGGKKKKGGLNLSPEQEVAITNFLGCLKFLSTINLNRFRIVHLGGTPLLMRLESDASQTVIRRGAHLVLQNCSMLAENRAKMLDAEYPEVWFADVPMHLVDAEIEQVAMEFEISPESIRLMHHRARQAAAESQ